MDERVKNVDLLIRSSLVKERTDNMAEVCEIDFRRALFTLNICIYKANIFLDYKHGEVIT